VSADGAYLRRIWGLDWPKICEICGKRRVFHEMGRTPFEMVRVFCRKGRARIKWGGWNVARGEPFLKKGDAPAKVATTLRKGTMRMSQGFAALGKRGAPLGAESSPLGAGAYRCRQIALRTIARLRGCFRVKTLIVTNPAIKVEMNL